jgi:hypothetical protein
MSERLCGYCRKPGHNTAKCDFRERQIYLLRHHAGMLRRDAHNLLIANGIGVGSLVSVYDFWSGEMIPCIVPSLKFIQHLDVASYKQKKYSKQVFSNISRLTLACDEQHALVRYTNVDKLRLECYRIDDMSKTMYATFYISTLEKRPEHIPHVQQNHRWFGENPSTLISESSDTDIDVDSLNAWTADIRMHPRLHTKDYMPALKPL